MAQEIVTYCINTEPSTNQTYSIYGNVPPTLLHTEPVNLLGHDVAWVTIKLDYPQIPMTNLITHLLNYLVSHVWDMWRGDGETNTCVRLVSG